MVDCVREKELMRLCQWFRAGYLGKVIEGYVFAAQEHALWTRFLWAKNEKEDVDSMCRVCSKEVESVGHLTNGFSGLVQREREYIKRHDRMELRVCSKLHQKYGAKRVLIFGVRGS